MAKFFVDFIRSLQKGPGFIAVFAVLIIAVLLAYLTLYALVM
ncbi:hypothetical protein [Gluconobacter morbifer]|nr:hypothetical protein [Gluconobacter morbifer]